jgi:hypothetical protein
MQNRDCPLCKKIKLNHKIKSNKIKSDLDVRFEMVGQQLLAASGLGVPEVPEV